MSSAWVSRTRYYQWRDLADQHGLEALWPWRKEQRILRPGLWSDYLHLVFNGHFLGVILFGLATNYVLPHLDAWLTSAGLHGAVYRKAAAGWPLWLQIVVALFATDFIHWCVHNMLHRVPWFWETHKVHHSVRDGEMPAPADAGLAVTSAAMASRQAWFVSVNWAAI